MLGERGGSVIECRTPEREVRGSRSTPDMLCPWARHFTPRKYWLITQEAMAPSRHDWKIVDWDVKPQHNQPTKDIVFVCFLFLFFFFWYMMEETEGYQSPWTGDNLLPHWNCGSGGWQITPELSSLYNLSIKNTNKCQENNHLKLQEASQWQYFFVLSKSVVW